MDCSTRGSRGQVLVELALCAVLFITVALIGLVFWKAFQRELSEITKGPSPTKEQIKMPELETIEKFVLHSQAPSRDVLISEQMNSGWNVREDLSKKDLLFFEDQSGRQRVFYRYAQNQYTGLEICVKNCSEN